jgi:NADH-quinone oxidoreductase subunit N
MIDVQVSGADLQGIMPLLVASGFGLLILLLDAFQRPGTSRAYLSYFAILGLVLTGAAAYVLWHTRATVSLFGGMAYMDGFGQAFTVIFVLSGILTCLLAPPFLKSHGADRGEFYALVLFATAGMILIATSGHLITVFLGLETMSISVYVLAGFFRERPESAEASLKYLILGALATGILLFGIALVYGSTGSLELDEIGRIFGGGAVEMSSALHSVLPADAVGPDAVVHIVRQPEGHLIPLAFAGMVLILVALTFKVAIVPFHMWVPDVYSGTPTPAVGFMATAVKAAGFAALLRIFVTGFFGDAARNSATGWVQILFVLAILTMVVGNFGAIVQGRLKRMLAYSSIAHAGYILVAFVAAGYQNSQEFNFAIVFYLVAYTFGTVGAFGVLAVLGRRGEEVETYEDLNELGYKYPALGLAMSVFMLSAAGIPPTAGFLAKFYAFKAAIDAAAGGGPAPTLMILLAVIGILASVAGIYYYLKVLVHLYMHTAIRVIRPLVSRAGAFALALCVAGVLGLGILPNGLTVRSVMSVRWMADSPEGPIARELPATPENGWTFGEDPLERAQLGEAP